MSEQKDYYIKDIEFAEENTNARIASNVIFATAGFILAGVAFGIGDQLFESSVLQTAVAFTGVGISVGNIRTIRNKLATKKAAKTYSKGKK